ncbi:MAG TPA: type III pantothenate kinase [Pyrinomonadaceae bacterium]|nr:type III pantothenate kinase [Pyrinomonadaceae bacterium]
MILAVDIGNTATKFGLFDGDILTSKFSIATKHNSSANDIRLAVGDRLAHAVDSAIVCSVVPDLRQPMGSFLGEVCDLDPIFVENSFDFGLKVNYDPLDSLGTDRLVCACAAVELYDAPVIICGMGTATTIDVVNADREFVGGVIAPGMDVLGDALHLKAPRLPCVEVARPDSIIGSSTAGSIGSGIYYGYVSMVEGLIERLRTESGVAKVIGTGGNALRLANEFAGMMTVDPDLLLRGLIRLCKP